MSSVNLGNNLVNVGASALATSLPQSDYLVDDGLGNCSRSNDIFDSNLWRDYSKNLL